MSFTIKKVSEIIANSDVKYKIIKFRNIGVRDEELKFSNSPEDEYMIKLISEDLGVKNIILI